MLDAAVTQLNSPVHPILAGPSDTEIDSVLPLSNNSSDVFSDSQYDSIRWTSLEECCLKAWMKEREWAGIAIVLLHLSYR